MSDNIYDYIKENFNIEVTDYQFKRDYIRNPLKTYKNHLKNEKPEVDDVKYLYITLNLTSREIGLIIKKYNDYIGIFCRKNNIIKEKKDVILSQENAMIRKYGRKNIFSGSEGYLIASNGMMTKYNVSNPSYLENIKEKRQRTLLKNYNITNPRYIPHLLESYKDKNFIMRMNKKRYETMIKNKTVGNQTSLEENYLYELLLTKFPDTIQQYMSEIYPFKCDFYIPSKNLYIEYQGHWKHGKEPYIGTKKQKEKVEYWKKKSEEINFKGEKKKTYKDAIYNWTIHDPLKRKTAKDNGLNWFEFFNKDDMIKWINSK